MRLYSICKSLIKYKFIKETFLIQGCIFRLVTQKAAHEYHLEEKLKVIFIKNH